MKIKILVSALLLSGCIGVVNAADQTQSTTNQTQPTFTVFDPTSTTWVAGPDALPVNAKMAVLAGDPKSSGAFTIRLNLPANYQIPAHIHSSLEQVTVISGDFHIGSGDKLNTSTGDALTPGSFVAIQPNTPHYAWTEKGAVIQLNGIGPWAIHYVDPKQDPRNKQ